MKDSVRIKWYFLCCRTHLEQNNLATAEGIEELECYRSHHSAYEASEHDLWRKKVSAATRQQKQLWLFIAKHLTRPLPD